MKNRDQRKERLKGATILAVICFIYSFLQAYAGIQTKLSAMFPSRVTLSPIFFYVIALYIACGVGLLKLETWARYLFIFLSSYKFVEFLPVVKGYSLLIISPAGFGFFQKAYNCFGALSLVLMKVAVPIVFIYYLTRPEVTRRFSSKS